MDYIVIITQDDLPHAAWEAEADTADEAIECCQVARTATGAHSPADSYTATLAVDLTEDDELLLAYLDAAKRMPALRERAVDHLRRLRPAPSSAATPVPRGVALTLACSVPG